MNNVIKVDTTPAFLILIHQMLKEIGAVRAREFMLSRGEHPSFVSCIIKKAMKLKGW